MLLFIIKATCNDMQVAFFTYSARLQRKTCAQLLYNTEKPISRNRYIHEIRNNSMADGILPLIEIIQDFT